MGPFENRIKLRCYPKKNAAMCVRVHAMFCFWHWVSFIKIMWFFSCKNEWLLSGKLIKLTKPYKKKKILCLLKYIFQWEACLIWKKLKFGVIFYTEIFVSFLVFSQFWVCFNTSKGTKLPPAALSKANRIKLHYGRTDLCQDTWTSFKTLQVEFRSYQILCP